jgi:hypothetical protein
MYTLSSQISGGLWLFAVAMQVFVAEITWFKAEMQHRLGST